MSFFVFIPLSCSFLLSLPLQLFPCSFFNSCFFPCVFLPVLLFNLFSSSNSFFLLCPSLSLVLFLVLFYFLFHCNCFHVFIFLFQSICFSILWSFVLLPVLFFPFPPFPCQYQQKSHCQMNMSVLTTYHFHKDAQFCCQTHLLQMSGFQINWTLQY